MAQITAPNQRTEQPPRFRFSREAHELMAPMGLFEGEQLIKGEVIKQA